MYSNKSTSYSLVVRKAFWSTCVQTVGAYLSLEQFAPPARPQLGRQRQIALALAGPIVGEPFQPARGSIYVLSAVLGDALAHPAQHRSVDRRAGDDGLALRPIVGRCLMSFSRSELDHQLAPVIEHNMVVLNREGAVRWNCYDRFGCAQLYRYDQRLGLTNQIGPNAEEYVGGQIPVPGFTPG